jgi:hypothetical protein
MLKSIRILITTLAICTLCQSVSFAQSQEPFPIDFFYKKGKGFGMVTKDSIFSINYQFRMQNRATFNSIDNSDLGLQSAEFRVRRLRMKFEGFVHDPRLT